MSQKNFWIDRGTETMHQTLVAEQAGQLDSPHTEAEPRMGIPMDEKVRVRGGAVVSGPVASTPRDDSESQFVFRAFGGSDPCPTEEQTKPSRILWRRGDLPRAGRSWNPPEAQRSDHTSDFGSAQAFDPQASGSIPEGGDPPLSDCQKTERRPPGRLHRGALFGFPSPRRHLQPEGWGDRDGGRDRRDRSERPTGVGLSDEELAEAGYSQVFADGQRHEPYRRPNACPESGAPGSVLSGLPGDSGLYPREAARLQCDRRALQWIVAREGLAEVSVPDVCAASEAFASLSGRLQRLPETKIDSPGQKRSFESPRAISAEDHLFSTPVAALSWADLVHTENR